jgi:hypothetical protein
VLFAPVSLLDGSSARRPQRIKLLSTPRRQTVDGAINHRDLVGLVGPPGASKTAVTEVLLDRVGSGSPFAERQVLPGLAVLFESEGQDEIAVRRERREKRHGVSPFYIPMSGIFDLRKRTQTLQTVRDVVYELRAELPDAPPLAVLAFDLLGDHVPGDLNDAVPMGEAMATLRAVTQFFDCTVVVVHHSNKANDAEPRGSVAFKGALDTMFGVAMQSDGTVEVTTLKSRAGQRVAKQFHWEDGVLVDGAARIETDMAGDAESDLELLARIVAMHASDALPLTMTQLREILSAERPTRYRIDPDKTNRGTVTKRVTRLVQEAVKTGYAVISKKKEVAPGPNRPVVMLSTGGMLKGVDDV